jgi:hypothetical protein
MCSIQVFGKKVSGWQVLPSDSADFENAAMRACELIIAAMRELGKSGLAAKKKEIPVSGRVPLSENVTGELEDPASLRLTPAWL